MKIFFDTEFTGLTQDTSLISIGLVTEHGNYFYAELEDYDKRRVDPWIKNNVIEKLFLEKGTRRKIPNNKVYDCEIRGTKEQVSEELFQWLDTVRLAQSIYWYSDVCHYDFVLLIDLLCGNALNMPFFANASCHDINQDLAKHFDISEKEAFDLSRRELAETIGSQVHNALSDAREIKAIYECIIASPIDKR